jgi:hypothetical protein
MDGLDGDWMLERRGGLLPPLRRVRKRIAGGRGTTRVGRLPGPPFDVVGDELRYRAPFQAFVDRLRPEGDGSFAGTALFRGHRFARFSMRRCR